MRLLIGLLVALSLLGHGAEARQFRQGAVSSAVGSNLYMATGNFSPLQGHPTDTGDGTHTYSLSRILFSTPAWGLRNPMIAHGAWYVATGNSGNQETNIGNSLTIVKEIVEYPIGTVAATITYSASGSVTISNGATVVSDPIALTTTANDVGYIWTCQQIPTSGTLPAQPAPFTQNGEGFRYGSASTICNDMNTLTTSNLGAGSGNFSQGPGVMGMVAQGWDGVTRVPIALGDSLVRGTNDIFPTTRGKIGHLYRALDDATSGRMAYMSFAASGTGATADLASSGWAKRAAYLAALPNCPGTSIISKMGQNDFGATPSQYVTLYNNWFNLMLTDVCANTLKIVQLTISPQVNPSSNHTGYTTTADQNPAAFCPPGGGTGLCAFNIDITNSTFSQISNYMDLTAIENAVDINGNKDLFPVPGHSWSLDANTSVNAKTFIIDGSTAPIVSGNIVVGIGLTTISCSGSEANCFGNVTAVTQEADNTCAFGPHCWSVTIGTGLVSTHSAGESVADNNTGDGDHLASSLYQLVAQGIELLKSRIF